MKNSYSKANEQIIGKVDNFNYDSNQQNFFQHRYIFYDNKGSPIMFCNGFEADIVSLCRENLYVSWFIIETK
ncbi:hypothetical protein BpHYR1_014448 [Brachionus plicatilis]|uniref:Uncharacterized protein n=1 Tax=Brachionus plicatilis TaxID=10195 RepID=A0A3M7Q8P7_BRAPC|nr:hypothetical protein BpHYR1_014448 [Brachionus plicatilis]